MIRRFILLLLLLFALPALACNMPVAPTGPAAPTVDVEQAVQQTLAASMFGTALPEQPDVPLPIVTAPLAGLETPTPGTPEPVQVGDHFQYVTQSGDTLSGLAGRFGVSPEQILDPMRYPPNMLLPMGHTLSIPNTFDNLRFSGALMPDSEIVYSPSAADFSIHDYIQQSGGFLSTYTEQVDLETLTGAQIVERVAREMSINPRMLLAVLEYRSNWVRGHPANPNRANPIGFNADRMSGLHKELTLVGRQLTIGYYGWRSGSVYELEFVRGERLRASPTLNAGSFATQYLFSKLYRPDAWEQELYAPGRFLAFYQEMFGSPWQRAAAVEPMLPDGLLQPYMELPFPVGERWSLTGGPHAAWGIGSPWSALDFAPTGGERGCGVSRFYTTAVAPGVVVRSERGAVVLDLDGDGKEETGWVMLYFHVATQNRAPVGTRLDVNEPLGHPSCEGGISTGIHVHLARKYNGEWIAADGPVPFVLSGWQAWAGPRPYSGTMTKEDQVVTARPDGARTSTITR
jgi:LasA protease